jgi:hypothetical protein
MKNQVKIFYGPFSIQPIILLVFDLTFLLLEWLLSENAVVGNLVGRLCRFLVPKLIFGTLPHN